MRFITWNLVLAAWLLISAFALGHSPVSGTVTFVAGLAVATLAIAAGGKPGLRYLISLIALAMAAAALLLPSVSGPARLSTALAAAILFALSLVSPRHGADHTPPAGQAAGS